MDVAVLAAKFFKTDKAEQARFNYSKTLKAQQGAAGSAGETPGQPVAA